MGNCRSKIVIREKAVLYEKETIGDWNQQVRFWRYLVRQQEEDIDEMQFVSMSWCETEIIVFILRQLHRKHSARKKNLYFTFQDLEEAFDEVPKDVVWWALSKLGVDELYSWWTGMLKVLSESGRPSVTIFWSR